MYTLTHTHPGTLSYDASTYTLLCKQVHTGAHRHSYTKLRQLRRGVKWGSPFREEEDTRTPTRTIWCIGVQYYTVMYKPCTKVFPHGWHECVHLCTSLYKACREGFTYKDPHRPHHVRPRPLLIWANDPSTSACWVGWEGSPLSEPSLLSSSS